MYYTLNIKNAKTEKENEYTDFEITLDDNYKNIIVTTYDSLTDKPTKYVTVDFEKIEYDLVGDRIYLIGVVENVDSLKNKPGKDKYEFNYVIEKNGKKVKDKVDSFLLRDDVKKGDEVKIPIYVNGLEKDEQYIIKLKTI